EGAALVARRRTPEPLADRPCRGAGRGDVDGCDLSGFLGAPRRRQQRRAAIRYSGDAGGYWRRCGDPPNGSTDRDTPTTCYGDTACARENYPWRALPRQLQVRTTYR